MRSAAPSRRSAPRTRDWLDAASEKAPAADPTPSSQTRMFAELDGALWLSHKLYRTGISALVFEGLGYSERRERCRSLIVEHRLAERPIPTNRNERKENFAEAFQRIFSEPLTTKDKKSC